MRHRILSFIFVLALCSACVQTQHADDVSRSTFTFGVIADVQYCDCEPRGSRYYRESIDKLAMAVEVFNDEDPEFIVQLGDLIDRDAVSYHDVLPVLQRIDAPIFHVLGNHDFSLGEEYRESDRKEALQMLGMKRAYYDYGHGGWRFVVLDGNDVSLHGASDDAGRNRAERMLASLREHGAVHAQSWNGGLGMEQYTWLDRTLAEADAAKEPVIIFCHFPVYPRDVHNLWNDEEVLELLDTHPSVVAYISGHNHAGGYATRRGVHFLTLHGMVETPDTMAFALIEATPRSLKVKGWGREPDRLLQLGNVNDVVY